MFWSLVLSLPTGLGPNPVDDPLIPPFDGDPNSVTPGVWGFFSIFLIAVVSILLIIDMSRRIRRVRYRGEVRERLEAEQEAARADSAMDAEAAALSPEGRVEGDQEDPRPVA